MEDRLIGFLVTVVIIIVIIAYIVAAISAAVESALNYLAELWRAITGPAQAFLDWLRQFLDHVGQPTISWPIPPAASPQPPTVAATPPVSRTDLLPGGRARYLNDSGQRLNCRAEPTTAAEIVARLVSGTEISLIERFATAQGGYYWRRVQPPEGTNCWVVENWLVPVSGTPVAGDTPVAGETPAANNLVTIRGVVTAGPNRLLVDVPVYLWALSQATPLAETTTNATGVYRFADLSADLVYRVEVVLQDGQDRHRILYGNQQLPVRVETSLILPQPGATITQNIDFADQGLIADDRFKAGLSDLATIYFYMHQFSAFLREKLEHTAGASPDAVTAFWESGCGTRYVPTVQSLIIPKDQSSRYSLLAPINREWHEFAHHLFRVTMPSSTAQILNWYEFWMDKDCKEGTEDKNQDGQENYRNHGGFDNWNSGDSWMEGWAEFWACVVEVETGGGSQGRCLYPANESGLKLDLEENWEIWDKAMASSRSYLSCVDIPLMFWCTRMEEHAVSGLLWDLYDPKNMTDNDNIDLSLSDLWAVFSRTDDGELINMQRVYLAFARAINDSHLTNERDGTPVEIEDLDQLFINHGFFWDRNRNHRHDEGEPAGYAGYRQICDANGQHCHFAARE